MVLEARGETDLVKRKELYTSIAKILWEEGGVICPMFNEFVEARRAEVGGWFVDPTHELMNGRALAKCWLNA